MFIFQTPPQMREKGLKMSLGVFARRSSVLDQTGADGQEAPGGACRQHGQVPLRGVGQPHAHHPLAQERQRLQGRAAHGRHQGQPGNSRFGLRRSCLTPTLPIGLCFTQSSKRSPGVPLIFSYDARRWPEDLRLAKSRTKLWRGGWIWLKRRQGDSVLRLCATDVIGFHF